jgi:hypothetical protein
MEIIAYCNNSCCPSIVINEKDPSQPVLITDDYQGSLPLTLREFEQISKHIANIQKTNVFPTLVSDRQFKIHGYKTDKPYISIELTDATGNTRKVKDISFDHWDVFTEAIAKHYAVA